MKKLLNKKTLFYLYLIFNFVMAVFKDVLADPDSGWNYSILPGSTKETIGSIILKTGDTAVGYIRMIGIIVVVAAFIIAGILIAISHFQHNYAMMNTGKTIMVVGAIAGLFVILAAPLIVSVILKWFNLSDKWTKVYGDTQGLELPVLGGSTNP